MIHISRINNTAFLTVFALLTNKLIGLLSSCAHVYRSTYAALGSVTAINFYGFRMTCATRA